MDSLTQIVLGAGIGEVILGKKVGNKAVLWGGIIATIPDLDVIPTIWMDSVGRLSFHRGFSHSLAFFFLASPIFGWLLHKFYQKHEAGWRDWTIFSFWVLFTHALLDCFTSWGTQLFWPHPYRVAWNTIFVVDPLYTVPFLITIVWLMFYNRESKMRQRINYAGLIISSVYLMLTVVNKQMVNNAFEQGLSSSHIDFERYSTKPTPFNNILWFAVAETKEDYCIGYYSFFDRDKEIDFGHHKKNHELLHELAADDKLQTLLYISNGYYAVENLDDSLLFHDLRFGQAINPKTGKGDFVFSFFLKKNATNSDPKVEITQKPRNFSDITSEMFIMLWRRMMGDKEVRI
jgi:inner membrane protein